MECRCTPQPPSCLKTCFRCEVESPFVLLRTQGKVPRLQHSVKGSDPYGVLSLVASRKTERVEMVERMWVVARGTMHARSKEAIPWARNCRVWVHLTSIAA